MYQLPLAITVTLFVCHGDYFQEGSDGRTPSSHLLCWIYLMSVYQSELQYIKICCYRDTYEMYLSQMSIEDTTLVSQ
jgi:hypothetical protein